MTDREKLDKVIELFILYIKTRPYINPYDDQIESELKDLMNSTEECDNATP